mgnify:CR=1 FL=1
MDSLLPAFIAILLASGTDRSAWLAAIMGDRYTGVAGVLIGFVIAQIVLAGVAVAGAFVLRPMMSDEARDLLSALALLSAGGGMMLRGKAPDRMERWRLGAVGTSALGGLTLGLGERAQFLIFAFAVAGAYPVLSGVGGAMGYMVAILPAVVLGEAQWCALPRRAFGIVAGAVFIVTGAIVALSALRLI